MPRKRTPPGKGGVIIDLAQYKARRAATKQFIPRKRQDPPTLVCKPSPAAQFLIDLYDDGTTDFFMRGVHEFNASDMLRAITRAIPKLLDKLPS